MLDWRVATLWCVGFAMSGWLVVRFRPAALLMFTIVVMAWGLTSTVVLMFAPAWYGLRWHAPYPDPTTFVLQAVAYLLLIVVVSPMLILIGGVAGPLASRSRPMGSR
jgi:cytochrome bd-type quinol oxidase subunit 1